jgi:hypothetical protein
MSERFRQFVEAMNVPADVYAYNRPVPFMYSRTGRHFPLLKLLLPESTRRFCHLRQG